MDLRFNYVQFVKFVIPKKEHKMMHCILNGNQNSSPLCPCQHWTPSWANQMSGWKISDQKHRSPKALKIYGCQPKNRGIWPPKLMVKIMENPIKMDDLEVPLFLETPPEFNSSPLKNAGWKTILTYWVLVTFQGRAVKLQGCIRTCAKFSLRKMTRCWEKSFVYTKTLRKGNETRLRFPATKTLLTKAITVNPGWLAKEILIYKWFVKSSSIELG